MKPRLALTRAGRFVVRVHPRVTARSRLFVRNHFRKWCVTDELIVTTAEGFRMAVSPHDYMSYGIYFYGDYDPSMTMMLKAHIPEGGVCWDVGTERGWFSLVMAQAVGPLGRVDAFEPYPANFARLQRNIALNALQCVHAHNLAVSNTAGTLWFVPPSDEVTHHLGFLSDCGGVGHVARERQAGALRIATITLDAHQRATGIDRLDFLKIDVEGEEVATLEGARETLARFRPLIAVEYNAGTAARAGSSMEELDALLDDSGYDRFTFSGRQLKRLRLSDWAGEHESGGAVFNVYAFPRR